MKKSAVGCSNSEKARNNENSRYNWDTAFGNGMVMSKERK